jgi:division/cell wall cluster transcriptional repressor MraZ
LKDRETTLAPGQYYGNYERKLDYKGRVAIPEDLLNVTTGWTRAILVRTSADLPGLDPFRCIFLYDFERWQELLGAAPRTFGMDEAEMRLFMHRVVGDAATLDLDALKRITIPERLLDHAAIQRQASVKFVGAFNHVEIWNPSTHASYIEAADSIGVSEPPTLFDVARKVDIQVETAATG